MATRSNIWLKCKDGKYRGVYCHWDGYPEWNGRLLLHFYKDYEKIEKLINLGSISSLGIDPTLPLVFEEHDEQAVKYVKGEEGFSPFVNDYHRWRNEEIQIMEDDKPQCYEEFAYIYDIDENDGTYKWYIMTDSYGEWQQPVLLTDDIAKDPNES